MRKNNKAKYVGYAAFAAGLSAACQAHALNAPDFLVYNIGPVYLRPHVSLSEIYNDNVLYRQRAQDRVSDLITTIKPGLNFFFGREDDNFITLDYTYGQYLYLDYDEFNTSDHSIGFGFRYKGTKTTIEGTDRIQMLSGILGGDIRANQAVVDWTSFNDNYRVSYDMTEKTGVYLQGRHDSRDYESGINLFDRNTLMATSGFRFAATHKIDLFGELHYGQDAVNPNRAGDKKGPHSWFFGGYVGVKGDFTSKLTGTAKIGYQTREYSDGSTPPNALLAQLTLDQQIGDKTQVSLNFSRRDIVSVQYVGQGSGRSYTANQLSLNVRQGIGSSGKWSVSAHGSYRYNEFDPTQAYPDRKDNWYRIGCGLNYDAQEWLHSSLGYEFAKFESSDSRILDYDANRITLQIALGY
ncbi:MAG: outer membrane beta-barrel protein [Verrucomicrobia bacterium]|nr:outer membrane beta-barrel protein [Verrucomicrobiota bacterium]